MIPEKFITMLLRLVVAELEKDFGPHPQVPVKQVKEAAKEYVTRFHLPDEEEILELLNAQIVEAFSREAGGVG